jgi:hypothetical protein
MVDVSEALESEYINIDEVERSENKVAIVVDSGSYELDEYNGRTQRKLTIMVDFNKKLKKYRPNRDSIKNLQTWGNNTDSWVNKTIKFNITHINGQKRINAVPHSELVQAKRSDNDDEESIN